MNSVLTLRQLLVNDTTPGILLAAVDRVGFTIRKNEVTAIAMNSHVLNSFFSIRSRMTLITNHHWLRGCIKKQQHRIRSIKKAIASYMFDGEKIPEANFIFLPVDSELLEIILEQHKSESDNSEFEEY